MEQHLRIALWTLVFVGCLQAHPIPSAGACVDAEVLLFSYTSDVDIKSELQNVSCEQNATFLSPANIQPPCFAAALATFEGQLELAKTLCNKNFEINDALDALEDSYKRPEQWPPANSTSYPCQWENQPFERFVEDMTSFVQKFTNCK